MTVKLLPGIVWALDEPTMSLVRQWRNGLPEKAKPVFNAATSWEEFTEIITHYQELGFNETLLQAGLSLEPQEHGRRVNVVVVGSLPCQGGNFWREAEEKLATVGAILSLEHHRVILYTNLPNIEGPSSEGTIDSSQLSSVRVLPWLLTRMVTGGFTLGEDEFFERFSHLLDVLLLAEREGGQVPEFVVNAFFRSENQPNHVRLAGFSSLSLERLLKEISHSLSSAILHRTYNRPYVDMKVAIQALERKLAESIGEFLQGKQTALQIEDILFSQRGVPHLSGAAILREIPDILTRQLQRLQKEEVVNEPPPSCLARLWQKLLVWFGKAKPPVSSKPDQFQKDYLINKLKGFSRVIQEIVEKARETHGVIELPPEFIPSWSDDLKDLLIRGMKEQWQAGEVTERLAFKITRDVQKNFSQAIFQWRLNSERVREMKRSLENGNLLRFSALLRGGMSVTPQALVTSFNFGSSLRHGAHNIPCANLRIYPGRPPYLVAASAPVAIENIIL
ncbi:MAG: hypothetical protein QXT73_02675 [Candidatus Methanomethylicaceae archaeon]